VLRWSFASSNRHRFGTEDEADQVMRFVHLYLIGYFILVIGALAALWYGGVLQRLPGPWIAIGLVIAAGLGVMLSITAGKPEITRE
jgi:hypothetical protein